MVDGYLCTPFENKRKVLGDCGLFVNVELIKESGKKLVDN